MSRHIIHLHIPAFPIAVARALRPELRGRPVAVAHPHAERGLILSSSLEARREGLFKGMPLGKAMKLCPHLTILSPDQALIEKAFQALSGVVAQYSPLWEPFRPGHIYLDVTGTGRLWGKAKDTADRLRREIQMRLHLTAAAGVAGNKMVSSIASRIMPSEGILDVDHGREARFLAPLRVGILPGIGPARRRMLLEELHIHLVREIAAMDMGGLSLIFGRQASLIHQRAMGIDPTPVYPPPARPMVIEEAILPEEENDDRKLLGTLYGLIERCSYRLRKGERFPQKAGILFRYGDEEEVRRRVNLPSPSFWDLDLYEPLEKAFLKACRRRVGIRFIRVWFEDFLVPNPQLSLFPELSSDMTGKKALATLAMDRIRERYGEKKIGYGR